MRRVVAAGAAAVVALVLAPVAQAACEQDIQNALDTTLAGGTVTLPVGPCAISTGLTLTGKALTIQGAAGGSTLDGTGLGAPPILKLTDARTTTIRDVTFRSNIDAGEDGAGLSVTGDTGPTLLRLRFFGNSALSPFQGGGAAVTTNFTHPTEGLIVRDSTFGSTAIGQSNAASQGGGLYVSSFRPIEVTRSSFVGNATTFATGGLGGGAYLNTNSPGTITVSSSTFADNDSRNNGGGLALGCGDKTLTGNTFARNEVFDPAGGPGGEWGGGGVWVLNCFESVTQTGNTFDHNSVRFGGSPAGEPSGAGELVATKVFTSRGDKFIGNEIPAPPAPGNAEGAGLALQGCNASNAANHVVENLVAAANRFTGAGAGGRNGAGVYIGCSDGPASVIFRNATIAGNTGGGGTSGLFGGPDDALTMHNSIVAGNSGGTDLTGFASKAITFSDACPLPAGPGNLCTNPLLVNAAAGNVHQTAPSPTLNKGSNAQVPAGLTTDFEGNARIQGTAVDIGADESVFAPGGGSAAAVVVDTVDPGVSASSIGRAFAVAQGSTPVTGQAAAKRKVKRGTTIRYTLSEAATVRLRIDKALKGRRVKKGKRRVCAKPTRKNRRKRRCTRYKRAGRTLVRTSKKGKNKVKFTGRIGRKALKRGSYRLTIVATDAAGNKSKARRLKFRIVKP